MLECDGDDDALQWETTLRETVLRVGQSLFGPMLQKRIDLIDAKFQPRPGQRLIGRRDLGLSTLFGEVKVRRDYYLGPDGGHFPADAALGFEGSTTAALSRLVCRAAAQQAFGAASRDLAEYGAIRVDERQVQRVVQRLGPEVEPWLEQLPYSSKSVPVLYVSCDGTGTPMRNEALVGRKGKQADGSSKTREVKLGAVFTQHVADADGYPLRDHESTSYVASYAPSSEFSLLLRAEARRRGVGSAQQVVFLSDGAAWAEDIAADCFAGCVSILDFYHASERLHELAVALDPAKAKSRVDLWKGWLLNDGVNRLIAEGRHLLTLGADDPEVVAEQLAFFERHRQRMAYGTYRACNWFIGSGVVEAGCRTVVGKRLKQSGMFWSVPGATCVLNFRTLLLSHRFDAFWKDRLAAAAARNDTLCLSV
ncbi:MAG: ISKra4 family transposase [Verrucomicrobiota bacterium]